MFSTPVSFFLLWPSGTSWVFLPLVLLGARRCVYKPGIASATLLMIALTLLLLAGHPETALHAVFAGCVYGLFELIRTHRDVARVVASATAAGIVALMSAIYLLPIPTPRRRAAISVSQASVVEAVARCPQRDADRRASSPIPALGQRWRLTGVRDVPLDGGAGSTSSRSRSTR
jgi:hypothetical protein